MAYVTVPKDLTRVKSKIVFGLTKRQLICFGGALLVGVPLYFLLRGRVTGSAAALIMVFAMLPGFLLALYKSLCFTGMKDRHGLYAVIGKDENRDKEVRRPRASIRRQLSETKQAHAPKKAPARTKKNELEV